MGRVIDISRRLKVRAALDRPLILVGIASETHENARESVLMTTEAYHMAVTVKGPERLLWPCEVDAGLAAYLQAYGGASEKIWTSEDDFEALFR